MNKDVSLTTPCLPASRVHVTMVTYSAQTNPAQTSVQIVSAVLFLMGSVVQCVMTVVTIVTDQHGDRVLVADVLVWYVNYGILSHNVLVIKGL